MLNHTRKSKVPRSYKSRPSFLDRSWSILHEKPLDRDIRILYYQMFQYYLSDSPHNLCNWLATHRRRECVETTTYVAKGCCFLQNQSPYGLAIKKVISTSQKHMHGLPVDSLMYLIFAASSRCRLQWPKATTNPTHKETNAGRKLHI